ncbi:hypothetical protein V501_01100, partial [Pseudogymnoascus sp. VKM F-4519 (FW-2642)]
MDIAYLNPPTAVRILESPGSPAVSATRRTSGTALVRPAVLRMQIDLPR